MSKNDDGAAVADVVALRRRQEEWDIKFLTDRLRIRSLLDYVELLLEGDGDSVEPRPNPEGNNPSWITQFIVSRWVRLLLMGLVIYLVALFTSHLWLGFLVSGRAMIDNDCLELAMVDRIERHSLPSPLPLYCSVKTHHLRREVDYHLSYQHIPSVSSDMLVSAARSLAFNDIEGNKHRLYATLDGMKLINMENLVTLLDMLRLEHRIECICPVFLGLLVNQTFIYDRTSGGWLLMHQAFVYRNGTVSQLVKPDIEYDKHLLYPNYRAFVSAVLRDEKPIHHHTVYVTYTHLSTNDAIAAVDDNNLKEYNRQLISRDIIEGVLRMSDPNDRTVPFRVVEEVASQKSLLLSSDDAACYHFCDFTNRRALGVE